MAAPTNINVLTDFILPYGGLLVGLGLVVWFVSRLLRERWLASASAEATELVMLQVLMPKQTEFEGEEESIRRKNFQEVMAVVEQFLASLSALAPSGPTGFLKKPPTISLELIANGPIRFYVGVPREYRQLLEKQILAYYPSATIDESKDFRIFGAVQGTTSPLVGAGCELSLKRRYILPLKTYKALESDPLNGVANAFSKLGDQSRGALQILIRPTGNSWQHDVYYAAKYIQEGKPPTMLASNPFARGLMWVGHEMGHALGNKKPNQEPTKLTPMQEEMLKDLNEKSSKVGYQTQIRLVTLAQSVQEAQMQLNTLTTAFSQFESPRGNGLNVKYVHRFTNFATDFVLRRFTGSKQMILNTQELASLYHFPGRFIESPNIQWLLARTLPPPVNLPEDGLILGKSVYRGEEKMVRIKDNDRRRHVYMIGKTGVGKTTLFIQAIEQDIKSGRGVCYMDPNGDAIEEILTLIPPERADDVIIFDPSDTAFPMGLNMLEWKRLEDRDFLVAEWLEIFYKLFDPNRTGMVGPQFEHWGRNASLTVMSMPGGGTLIDIPRLFVDDAFREKAVSYVTDPVVKAFWEQQLAKTADFHKSEMYNYFISKFGRFMTNDLIRNIIGQTKSSFDFRDIMDSSKIFLVNLSKGKIGETNSYLLGMILVSKLQVAAFQRADTPEETRKDFYLYVDEFQNFTTNTFKTILSEARKYRLDLAITNQYIAQLPEEIRDAVIGNAGTIISYRIGAADAEFLAKEFPHITKEELTNLTFASTYIKLLIDGTPSKPFSMQGIKTATPPNHQLASAIRQLSRLKYGRPAARVEAELDDRMLLNAIQRDQTQSTDALPLA